MRLYRVFGSVEKSLMALGVVLEFAKGRFPLKWRLEWVEHEEVVA